jgi:phage major head subunit gpT-like protein
MDGFNISVTVNPRLTWTDKIATFRADGGDGGAPFIRQEEKPLTSSKQAEDSPEEFSNDRWLFGVDYTGAFGYGFWQHANLATMT